MEDVQPKGYAGLEARFSGVNFTQMRLHDYLKSAGLALAELEENPFDQNVLIRYRGILRALITELNPIVPKDVWEKWTRTLELADKATQSGKRKWLKWARDALWLLHRSTILLMQDYGLLYKLRKLRTLNDDTKVLDNYIKAEVGA